MSVAVPLVSQMVTGYLHVNRIEAKIGNLGGYIPASPLDPGSGRDREFSNGRAFPLAIKIPEIK